MTTVRDVAGVMENWAPPSLAESWDNPGLAAGDPAGGIETVLISLDVTKEALDAASAENAAMIVSHHPTIFRPLASLAGDSPSVRVVRRAVRENIALFSAHTNLDQVPGGVSHAAAARLGVTGTVPFVPGTAGLVKFVTFCPPEFTDRIRDAAGSAGAGVIGEYRFCSFSVRGTGAYVPGAGSHPFSGEPGKLSREEEDRIEMIAPSVSVEAIVRAVRAAHPYEEPAYDIVPLEGGCGGYGYGAVGDLSEPMDGRSFARHVARALGIDSVFFSGDPNRMVRRVAVMGGSGRDHIRDAAAWGADAYVTGEIGHHAFLESPEPMVLVDASHRATELPVLEAICSKLSSSLPDDVRFIVYSGTPPFATMDFSAST